MPGREELRVMATILLLVPPVAATGDDAVGPTAPPEAQERSEEIAVTGTRIRGRETPARVTVIGRDRIAASGRTLGDFLQTLAVQGNATNTGVNLSGDGATRINLRGIGASRTLVLVNGRRWVPGGTGADPSVDLDSIPTAAIERIEVLEGGASAVYGSDAIAGVVNVITRRGGGPTEASIQTGTSAHRDGTTADVSLTTGTRSSLGGILLSAGYFDQRSVMARDRTFSRFPYSYDANVGEYVIGSGTVPAGRTLVAGATGTGNQLWNDLVATGGSSFIWDPGPAGPGPVSTVFCGLNAAGTNACFRRYLGDGLRSAGQIGDGYNWAADGYLVTPQRRVELFSAGDLKLGSSARAFLEASYVNRRSRQERSPEPLALDGTGLSVAGDNVYNPFGLGVYVRRRLTELGPGRTRQHVDTVRVVGGVEGGAAPGGHGELRGWSWDLSLDYGRTDATVTMSSLLLPMLAAALGPSFRESVGIDGIAGTGDDVYRCGTPNAPIDGCVPLNLFGGPGSITPDQLSGVTFTEKGHGFNELRSFQANASGALFDIVADRPVALAVGYEHRELSGAYLNDPLTAGGLTTGPNGVDTRGGYRVNELHGELSIPIASGAPGAQDVEAIAAARWFHYSTFGSDWTYELGGRWRPTRDVAIRGKRSTAFRAPTIQESYRGPAEQFQGGRDPCRGEAAGGPPIGEACLQAGVPPFGTGDESAQLRSLVGGNPDLGPERATVATVGVVLEPRWAPSLSLSADYYRLDIDGTVGSYGAPVLVSGCYSGTNPGYCGRIVRDPGTHFIAVIDDRNGNVGKLSTAGVDLAARYALATPRAGRFTLAFDATWLQWIDQTLPDGTVIHGKGTFDLNALNSGGGAGGAFPAWKANAGVTWGLGGLGAGIATRYLGPFRECGDSSGAYGAGLCYVDSSYRRKVSAYHAEDVFVSYAFSSFAGKTSVSAGVRNLFDAAPPRIYNGLAATDQYNYEQVGRFFHVRLGQTR